MCRRGPPLFGYIHPQEVANLGAFSIERHQNTIINSGLECRFGGYTAHHLGNIVKHLRHILASRVNDAVPINGRLCYWRIETLMSVQFPLPKAR